MRIISFFFLLIISGCATQKDEYRILNGGAAMLELEENVEIADPKDYTKTENLSWCEMRRRQK